MTLDEIERLAIDYRAACEATGNAGCVGHDLALALIVVLPVVKAAEAWHKANGLYETGSALAAVLSHLHATTEGK